MGYLFGICVEKNSELGASQRKFKYRVVFQGNRVIDQNYEAAIFQDLGSTPATLEASRVADALGDQDSWAAEVVGAEQAYVQADMKGTPTWVCLPPNQRAGKSVQMEQPVYRLKKVLYGHPRRWRVLGAEMRRSCQVAGFGSRRCRVAFVLSTQWLRLVPGHLRR